MSASCLHSAWRDLAAHDPFDHRALKISRRMGLYVWLVRMGDIQLVVKLAGDPLRADMLAHEAAMLRRLEASGIAPRLVDHRQSSTSARLVMTYLSGQHPSVPLAGQAAALTAVGRAIDAAHTLGVVHCDLKPTNVILDDGRAWLLDWATAANIGTPVKGMGWRPYSSGYTHPDLIWGRGFVSPQYDHYALSRFIVLQDRDVALAPTRKAHIPATQNGGKSRVR